MMNIGEKPFFSDLGIVTSLGWKANSRVQYVLEGNINYTGAVISWLKDSVGIIKSPDETEEMCYKAEKDDELYLVPAFTGLGAPYWKSDAKGVLVGITRTTEKAEIVRAGVECIGYQITDIIKAMEEDTGIVISELRVDGGPTKNKYLMQFQSDIVRTRVLVPKVEELSGIGAAYMSGLALNLYNNSILDSLKRESYSPKMKETLVNKKYKGWKNAVKASF